MTDPTARFSDRVAAYERGRPGYPGAVVDVAEQHGLASTGAIVVDLGAGTGLLTKVFLDRGYAVYAVEPNDEMRQACARKVHECERARVLGGRAESIDLEDSVAHLFVAGQAFHWFDPTAVRAELLRVGVSRPGLMAIWNMRRTSGTPALEAYEVFLKTHGIDYAAVSRTYAQPAALATCFGGPYRRKRLENVQHLNRDGFRSRVTSSSYMPGTSHPGHQPMTDALERLFDDHAIDGSFTITYDTDIYLGPITPDAIR